MVGSCKRKRALGRPTRRLENNVKLDNVGYSYMHFAQDEDLLRTVMNTCELVGSIIGGVFRDWRGDC
jgi:hypothetical protein